MAEQEEAPENEPVSDLSDEEQPEQQQEEEDAAPQEENDQEPPQDDEDEPPPPQEEDEPPPQEEEDEPPQEEAPKEAEPPKKPEIEAKEPEPEPEPEPEQKEEPKKKAPSTPKKKGKKKKRKSKKKSSKNESNEESFQLWKKLSKKGSVINWYICKLAGKVGKTTTLTLLEQGSGGAAEIAQFLADKDKSLLFGLLKCITTDDAMSVRAKFVYLRFVGTGVGAMSKARLTPCLGKIDDQFPCKHLTININEQCSEDLAPKQLAVELLRVGGAHKPDKMEFGPDQHVLMSDL